jgi:hypothetical protein
MPRNPHVLFAVVTHLDEGVSLGKLLTLKVEKIPNLRSGHMETNSIRNRTVYCVPVNVNKK